MTNTSSSGKDPLTYAQAGVDIDAGNQFVEAIKPLAKSTDRPGIMGGLGGFGGLFDLKAAGYKDPVLVAANDGVGTKVKIAIEAGKHDTVGIDLVAMCVNDLIVQGAAPLFFLDYFATGKLDIAVGRDIVAGIAEGCRQANCALIGGETAEMPGLYTGTDYDLAGFSVGAAERGMLLPRSDITAGDKLIALASSGAHSNGFSLIRKIVEKEKLTWSDPAPFDPEQNLGEALLTPTRIYVRSILKALEQSTSIKALAHITGGGLTENLPRVLPKTLKANIDLGTIKVSPVFRWLAKSANLDEAELLKTFNCGVGMVVVVAAPETDALLNLLRDIGEDAYLIGELSERGSEKPVTYSRHLDLKF